jgi:glyoxylase-like metal-dependent hydrolase (beta-lactamase superfamily II)
MILVSQSENAVGCRSGSWGIWSLSDGYVDLPAHLLREPDDGVHRPIDQLGSMLRLSVNCFFLRGSSDVDSVLIDGGAGGSWDPSMGHLEAAMAEAGVEPASITKVAFTHGHRDHVNGLLTRDGRELLPNLKTIFIAGEAANEFLHDSRLARFKSYLTPIDSGDRVASDVQAIAIPGHAMGHIGYALNTGEDNILCCGDLIHVPAVQFAWPELTWAYDENQSVARATRVKLLQEAATAETWLAGAHMGRPGICRVKKQRHGFSFESVVEPHTDRPTSRHGSAPQLMSGC